MTSTVAGFRLDAPAAIRYAAKYTMSAFNDGRMLDHALCSCIDDLFVNPAILRIRVRAIQVSVFLPDDQDGKIMDTAVKLHFYYYCLSVLAVIKFRKRTRISIVKIAKV
jgi:hypothetical protein